MNILPLYAITALIPLLIGFIWYNPKVFGTAWMKATGITPDGAKGMNMAVVFIITYIMGFFFSAALGFTTIHQFGAISLSVHLSHGTEMSEAAKKWLSDTFSLFGHSYRTYKHGAFHGTLFGITAVLPVVVVNALFERRGFKYIAINAGFWILCCIIMGAIICHWAILHTDM